MKIKPWGERVLVKLVDMKKPGGLIIVPETSKKRSRAGEVMALGGSMEMEFSIAVGDKIIFGDYAGEEVMVDGDKHLIISETDILGTWTD